MLQRYIRIFEDKEIVGSTEQAIASFQPKDNLNPALWGDNNKLLPEVRDDLLKIATDFYDSLDIGSQLEDIIIVGSSANFNWSQFSDLDVHLRLDYGKVNPDKEFVRKYLNALKSKWNSENDIKIHDVPVELYAEDISGNLVSGGIYSIMLDKWIVEPQHRVFSLEAPEVRKKAEDLMSEIDDLLQCPVSEECIKRMNDFWDKLKQYRQAGLEKGGEFSIENWVFKVLRRNGYLQKLSDYETKVYDELYSIK